MSELKEKHGDKQTIEITDENYLEVMELIYNHSSEFIGKKSAMKDLFTKHRTIAMQMSSVPLRYYPLCGRFRSLWLVNTYA